MKFSSSSLIIKLLLELEKWNFQYQAYIFIRLSISIYDKIQNYDGLNIITTATNFIVPLKIGVDENLDKKPELFS